MDHIPPSETLLVGLPLVWGTCHNSVQPHDLPAPGLYDYLIDIYNLHKKESVLDFTWHLFLGMRTALEQSEIPKKYLE